MTLLFEAIDEFSEEEKETVRSVLSALVLQHSARRWDAARNTAPVTKAASKRTTPTRSAK
jgi:hypothetical protein